MAKRKSTTNTLHIIVNIKKNRFSAVKRLRRRILLPLTLLLTSFALLLAPQQAAAATARTLALWFNSVVPSLLPFFIISRLLIGLGTAEAAGRCFSPLTGPLFNLPGAAALGVLPGFCSGFPTGAAAAAALRRRGALNREQAGRLLCFTNNAGPLYISAAVAASLLHRPDCTPLLMLGHYGSDLLLGIILGCLSRRRTIGLTATAPTALPLPPDEHLSSVDTQPKKKQSIGLLMRDCALQSVESLLLIACYMCLFSLPICLLDAAADRCSLSVPPFVALLISGISEMSLGMAALAESSLPLQLLLPLAAAQLSFGGFCVQLQVCGMIAETDIDPRPYLLCRPLHALLSAALTRLLLPLFPLTSAASVMSQQAAKSSFITSAGWGSIAAAVLIWLAAAAGGWRRMKAEKTARGKTRADKHTCHSEAESSSLCSSSLKSISSMV